MATTLIVQLTLEECCQLLELPAATLVEIVEYGIVQPSGHAPQDWRFDEPSLSRMQRARRLQRELELDWQAVAVTLDLLSELERLRAENRMLKQRLQRFAH